ncbi:hypothetical protein KY316_02095 [Candidatus Woesearchaeota archaeon]|nr:hypothetical protein [Candidatus Woesearchaeota archaeon]
MKKYIFGLIIMLLLVSACEISSKGRFDLFNEEKQVVELTQLENGQQKQVEIPFDEVNPMQLVLVVGENNEAGMVVADGNTYVIE